MTRRRSAWRQEGTLRYPLVSLLQNIFVFAVPSELLHQLSHLKIVNHHIDDLVQDCSNSSALAMELLQPWTKPLTYCDFFTQNICKRSHVANKDESKLWPRIYTCQCHLVLIKYCVISHSRLTEHCTKHGNEKCNTLRRLDIHKGTRHPILTGKTVWSKSVIGLRHWLCFNSMGPSDAIWHWRSCSTMVQVMACCLTAPSHYLNQCWLIISKVLWHSFEDIIIRRFEDTNQ